MRWSEVMNKVAAALADWQLPDAAGGNPDNPVSLLTALTGSIPPGLRRRLRPDLLGPLGQDTAIDDVEPLIYQNEFPVSLLAAGIVDVAAQAVDGACGLESPRITAIRNSVDWRKEKLSGEMAVKLTAKNAPPMAP